jgi:hypothetical protein
MFGKKRPENKIIHGGSNNNQFIHGLTCQDKHYYCKCGKETSHQTVFAGKGRCADCFHKEMQGRKHPHFGKVLFHGKRIWYKDNCFHSQWEVNFAQFLDDNDIKWIYEPKAFDLGDTTYTPDFYLPETNEYIEIKGYWIDDAKFKFDLTKIFYPEIKIQLIMEKDLKELGIAIRK